MRTSLIALSLACALSVGAQAAPKQTDTFKGTKAYIYRDKKANTWRIGNDVMERTVRYDPIRGSLRTIKLIPHKGGPSAVASGPEATFRINAPTPVGQRTLTLDRDWTFAWQSYATPAHRGRQLTIHLQGRGANDGFEVETVYEVLPGNRPYETMTATLINRTGVPITVTSVDYAGWALTPVRSRRAKTPEVRSAVVQAKDVKLSAAAIIDTANGNGLVLGATTPETTITPTMTNNVVPHSAGPREVGGAMGARYFGPTFFASLFGGGTMEATNVFVRFDEANTTARTR